MIFRRNTCIFQIIIVSLPPKRINNNDYGSNDNRKTT